MSPLILTLVRGILIPELAAYIQRRQAAGQPITEAELVAEFEARLTRIITVGEAWLAEHPA